jgi:hypothetical protein
MSAISPVQGTFVDAFVSAFERMAGECEENVRGVRSALSSGSSPDGLLGRVTRGIWYPQEYFRIYKKVKAQHPLDPCVHEMTANLNNKGMCCISGHWRFQHYVSGDFEAHPSRPNVFRLKGDSTTSPAEALLAIGRDAVSFLDCAFFCNLVFFRALLEFLGSEAFNTLFQGGQKDLRFELCRDLEQIVLDGVFEEVPLNALQKGDRTYIRNDPDYALKHPQGEAAGYHVVVRDTDAFLGLGLPVPSSRQTLEKILADALAEDPINLGSSPAIPRSRELNYGVRLRDGMIEDLKGCDLALVSRLLRHLQDATDAAFARGNMPLFGYLKGINYAIMLEIQDACPEEMSRFAQNPEEEAQALMEFCESVAASD